MKISKFRKYISWNVISVTGYVCSIIAAVFFILLVIASSQLNMRADLNQYFYDYILSYLIEPYFSFYKIQLSWIMLLLIVSVLENRKYKQTAEYGLRIFENNEKGYSIVFSIGLVLNFLPLYLVFMYIVINYMRLI